MTFLPIVERELRAAARLPATYRNRWLGAGVVTLLAVIMMLFAGWTMAPSLMGGVMFRTLAYLALVFCLLEGVRKTADCLSQEKREGTLGLLFLTDLKGYDVVLGKLAATSLNSVYGLVSILPVLALPLLMGGVTMEEYWRVVFALLNILFFSLCVGMCVSSFSVREQQAAAGTFFVLLLTCAIPLVTLLQSIAPLSPLYAFHASFDSHYRSESNGYAESLAATQIWSWLLLIVASLATPRSWQERETVSAGRRIRPETERVRLRRAARRAEMLESNPILWLTARRGRKRHLGALVVMSLLGSILYVIVSGVTSSLDYAMAFIVCAYFFNLWIKVALAAQAVHVFAESRRTNLLEMLLATPLTIDQIVKGQLYGLARIYGGPCIFILGFEYLALLIATLIVVSHHPGSEASDINSVVIIVGMIYPLFFLADLAAMAWSGLWYGLTSKNETQAIWKTIFFVLIVPLLLIPVAGMCCFPGNFLVIVYPLIWIAWVSSKIYRRLREIGGPKYGLVPVTAYTGPPLVPGPPRIKPPVIT